MFILFARTFTGQRSSHAAVVGDIVGEGHHHDQVPGVGAGVSEVSNEKVYIGVVGEPGLGLIQKLLRLTGPEESPLSCLHSSISKNIGDFSSGVRNVDFSA